MQTLQWIKTLANGSIIAIHYQKNGWLRLIFRNREDFVRRQKEISDLD